MDPNDPNPTYPSFPYLQSRIIPPRPIPDTIQVQDREKNRLEVHSDSNMYSNSSPRIARDDWTVHGPQIARGNFGVGGDTDDPRMSVGWKEGAAPAPAGVEDLNTRRWGSPVQDRPFMWDVEYGAQRRTQVEANTHESTYPHPNLSLPHPSLNLDFRMSVSLNPRISVGATPFGHRNWISFTGGTWSGSWGSGIVLPGGQDSQLVVPDGSARLETNYLLQTHDDPPAHIAIKTHGWRTGPPEVLAQLADPAVADQVDPNSYKFRLFIEMETGDERYSAKVNCGMWVGSGMRKGAEVIYDAYRVS